MEISKITVSSSISPVVKKKWWRHQKIQNGPIDLKFGTGPNYGMGISKITVSSSISTVVKGKWWRHQKFQNGPIDLKFGTGPN